MEKEQPKGFLIQPETNNSCTIWLAGRAIKIIASRQNRLDIVFDEADWEADISGDSGNVCLIAQRGVAGKR